MKNQSAIIKILLAGDGGQGVQTIAQILAQAAFKAGKEVSLIPNYGLEQRGGMSLAYLQISDQSIVYPRFTEPDYLALMSEQARPRITQYLSSSKQVLETEKYISIIKEKGLPTQCYNMVVLGVLAKILEDSKVVDAAAVKSELETKLGQKAGLEENFIAFNLGISLINE